MSQVYSTAMAKSPAARQLDTVLELRAAGRFAEALDLLASPGEYDAHLRLVRGLVRAEIEFALGRFEQAALSYSAVVISDPQSVDAHYNRALCLERCGRWDVASEAFEHVLRLDPNSAGARLGLGACLLHLNRAQEALANFNGAGLQTVAALAGKAVALQMLRRFDEAARVYEIVLASDPDSEEALSNLIAMGIETRNLQQVRDHSQRLLKIRPDSTVALQALATVAFENSDHAAAAYYCDQLLEFAPDCLEAWHNFRIAMDQSSFHVSEPELVLHRGGTQ